MHGSLPKTTLAVTLSHGSMDNSWKIVAMPSLRAVIGLSSRTGSPSRKTVPDVGAMAPASTLISVDLPAPFSPMRA